MFNKSSRLLRINVSADAFLTAKWRYLVMLNYRVDAALLRPYVPAGTQLDSWKGENYISLVGFQFLDTKILGLPIPWHRNFEEVNLRFYVRRVVNGELRRGVVFLKEIVPRFAIAFVARQLYNEKYVTQPMSHEHLYSKDNSTQLERVNYSWGNSSKRCALTISVTGSPASIAAGSQEEFITEHYWGYAQQRNGTALEYHVAHPRWSIWNAEDAMFCGDASNLYGRTFNEIISRKPGSAFLADGSEVSVYKGVVIEP